VAAAGASMSEPRGRTIVLGRVAGAHALDGEIRVQFFGDGPEQILGMHEVNLGADPEGGSARTRRVRSARPGRSGEVRLVLEDVDDRYAAEALGGLYVTMDAGQLETLPEGEHYWFELIGCRVEGKDGAGIGTVREIWETGAHDVLVIDADDGSQKLVPTADEIVEEVDIEGRRIVIEVIPGLLDPE
jgi:16S rRNA processing protein RimM